MPTLLALLHRYDDCSFDSLPLARSSLSEMLIRREIMMRARTAPIRTMSNLRTIHRTGPGYEAPVQGRV